MNYGEKIHKCPADCLVPGLRIHQAGWLKVFDISQIWLDWLEFLGQGFKALGTQTVIKMPGNIIQLIRV